MQLFGQGENPRNFVAAADVAYFAVRALLEPDLAGEVLEIGGPENLTNMQVVRLFEEIAGKKSQRVPRSAGHAAGHGASGQPLQFRSQPDHPNQHLARHDRPNLRPKCLAAAVSRDINPAGGLGAKSYYV